ncbi:uncharacterized protein LOC134216984 [Armigeres subalbatus]|uniref:uncharacterized protein LOC134216984 n=1 Tax=Armigeres subalbatus TaxID=124917 RepID=UPI002ED0620D
MTTNMHTAASGTSTSHSLFPAHYSNQNPVYENLITNNASVYEDQRNAVGPFQSTIIPMATSGTSVQQVGVSNTENSASQPITIPVIIASDGKPYAQLENGNYYALTDNDNEVIMDQLSNIKQDEVDLGVDTDLQQMASSSTVNEYQYSVITELRKINVRLDAFEAKLSQLNAEVCKTNDRLNVQEGLLVKLTDFMANVNKLMLMKNSNDATPIGNRYDEEFTEFESMPKINSVEAFKIFEQRLSDTEFSGKFFRYTHSIYSLNGKRDSGPLFRTIVRKLITPNVLTPFSWMGNKRTKKGSDECSHNINFQETFPNFIKLMQQVMQAADCSNTREQSDHLFKTLLRYKNLELKRYESGSGERRASSSRKRQKAAGPADAIQTPDANFPGPSQAAVVHLSHGDQSLDNSNDTESKESESSSSVSSSGDDV